MGLRNDDVFRVIRWMILDIVWSLLALPIYTKNLS